MRSVLFGNDKILGHRAGRFFDMYRKIEKYKMSFIRTVQQENIFSKKFNPKPQYHQRIQ